MNDKLLDILEKYKRAGQLDQKRSGADGKEDDFIGKHTDNVETFDGPGVAEVEKAIAAVNHAKRAPHHGYEVDSDEEVYESAEYAEFEESEYDDETLESLDYDDDDLLIEEDATFYMNLIDEVVETFLEEEADEEEKALLEEMLSTDEGYEEFIDILFEGKTGVADETDGDGEDVINANPKLKGKKAKGDGKSGGKDTQMVKEDIERKADIKMIKTKTPEGKVVWRRMRGEIEVSKRSD